MKEQFEYSGDLTVDSFKELYKYGNFQELTDSQIEFIFENSKWKYQCEHKKSGQVVAMCRCITDEATTLIITDIVVHPDWHYKTAHFAQQMIDYLVEFFVDNLEDHENLKVILTNMDEWSYNELSETFTGTKDCLIKVFNSN